jgi:hypothetical protein
MSQLSPLLGCFFLGACPIVACSVINQFDDVVPAKTASGGAGGSANSTGGSAASSGKSEQAGGEAGASTGAGGGASVPSHGLLAVAGTDPTKGDTNVVSLIDPATGSELTRQTIDGAAVAGLAYDGAANKDVWYEFTAAAFPADPTSKAALQVYSFQDATSTWKAISTTALPGLPPPRPNSFVVLNDRLAYLSYNIVSGQPVDALTVLDTTDPTAVTQIKVDGVDFGTGSTVLGMVGTRGVLGDETAPGGTLAVLVASACTGQHITRLCGKTQLLPITVGADVSQGVAVDFSTALVGDPAFVSAQSTQLGYIAFTPGPNQSVSIKDFDPRNLQTIMTGAPAVTARWLGGLAYAECQDVALFTAVEDQALYASSSAGLTDNAALPYPGENVVYEPFTGHTISLYNPSNTEFAGATTSAIDDGGMGGAAGTPALNSFNVTKNAVLTATATANWNPPTNLAPNTAVARFPASFACP